MAQVTRRMDVLPLLHSELQGLKLGEAGMLK